MCECGSECEGSVTSRTSTEVAWRGRGRHEKGRRDEGALSGYMACIVVLAGGQVVDARDSRLPCRASRGAYPQMPHRVHHVHYPGSPSSAEHVRQSSPFPSRSRIPPHHAPDRPSAASPLRLRAAPSAKLTSPARRQLHCMPTSAATTNENQQRLKTHHLSPWPPTQPLGPLPPTRPLPSQIVLLMHTDRRSR